MKNKSMRAEWLLIKKMLVILVPPVSAVQSADLCFHAIMVYD